MNNGYTKITESSNLRSCKSLETNTINIIYLFDKKQVNFNKKKMRRQKRTPKIGTHIECNSIAIIGRTITVRDQLSEHSIDENVQLSTCNQG